MCQPGFPSDSDTGGGKKHPDLIGRVTGGGKRLPEARAALQKALERNPNYADAHHNLGYVLEQLGDADQAVHHYHQALKNQPNHRLAHFHLGSHYVSAGQYDQAIEHLEETLTPEDERAPRFHYVLADAYTRAGNRPKAIEHARKARDLATRFGQRLLAGLIQEDLNTLESMSAASR